MKLLSFVVVLSLTGAILAQKPPTSSAPKGKMESAQNMQQVNDAKLKQLESAYASTKAAFTKKPKDTKAKNAYVNATFQVGIGRMYSVSLPPRAKYSTALEAFREVLKIQPNHKPSQDNYKMIADIYKKMGRPVPGEK